MIDFGYKIKEIEGKKVLDSRGDWTIRITVKTKKGFGEFIAPSGKSKGLYEAVYLPVDTALRRVDAYIKPNFTNLDVRNQKKIDLKILFIDGTKNKSKIGGNTSIALSIACFKCACNALQVPFWRRVKELYKTKPSLPIPVMNLINGGIHAGSYLTFQEFLVIPEKLENIEERIDACVTIFHALKETVRRKFGKESINYGDEGGIVPRIHNNEVAIELLSKTVSECGYEGKVFLGLDCAALSFYRDGKYFLELRALEPEKYFEYIEELLRKYKEIKYIEDPFAPEDYSLFGELKKKFKYRTIVGDDLFCTNPVLFERLKRFCNGIIIKPNQIGTLEETMETLRLARKEGYKIIISHRSGDTCDGFITDLAVGAGADYLKAGAPNRGERIVKYNRLLEISSLF